ncbi:FtsX-like permease family protein [bacterium]|nr:FtsX-like permease family protein [bacterium]
MSLIRLSLAFAWHHRIATLCTSLSVALAIAVVLLVVHVREDVEQEIVHERTGSTVAEIKPTESLIREGLLAYGSVLMLLSTGMILATLSLTTVVRRRDHAILRALGARPHEVFLVVIGEALLQVTVGAVLGIFVSRIALTLMEVNLLSASALLARLSHFHWVEWGAVVLAYAAGLLASLIPAWQAYRLDVASGLKR